MDSDSTRVKQMKQLPTLPQDVIQNILSRLPVKSLLRFRCVSKSLDSLARDPQFVKTHLHRTLEDLDTPSRRRVFVSTDPSQCILCENLPKEDAAAHGVMTMAIEYPSGICAADVEIIGSCNGLLCFMVADSFTIDEADYRFILWNPITRACRELAKPGPLVGHFPDVIPIYGFGYDALTDDYKIIRAVSPHNGTTSTHLEIYTLKDNAWRKMQASLPCILTASHWRVIEPEFPGIFSRGAGVSTNGTVHWLEKRIVNAHESDLILSFNLAKEKFEEVIPLVEYNKEDSSVSELGVLGGHLSVLVHIWNTSETEIWVMKEYGKKASWSKITTMPADPGPAFQDSFMGDWLVPISICANGCLLVDMDGIEVLIYDPQRKSFSKIELGGNSSRSLVQEFVETLVSPHGI